MRRVCRAEQMVDHLRCRNCHTREQKVNTVEATIGALSPSWATLGALFGPLLESTQSRKPRWDIDRKGLPRSLYHLARLSLKLEG